MFEINDLDTYLEDDGTEYHESAYDYFEHVKIINDDINYVGDLYALARGILAVLKTRIGEIDGVGMENFGSRLLTLRGQRVDNLVMDLTKIYINETIPQFKGRVYSFTILRIAQKGRDKIMIHLQADTIYGLIDINLAI
jgi:L-lysine 2,3-aminomutase